jgi:hypothetical protein
MPARTQLPWRYIHLVWFPVLACFAAELVLRRVATQPGAPAQYLTPTTWDEASARLQLAAVITLFFIYTIVVLSKVLWDLYRFSDWLTRAKLLIVFFVCGIASSVLFVLAYCKMIPIIDDHLGYGLVHRAALLGINQTLGPMAFRYILSIFDILAAVAVAAFIAAGISCVARYETLDEQDNWIFQSERLKTYIYLSAGLLVLGIVSLKAWALYPGYTLSTEPLAHYTALVNSYAMFAGVEYSLILSAYALPVAVILSRRADEIATAIVMREANLQSAAGLWPYSSKVKKAREQAGLVMTPQDVMKTVAALLAPLITGTIASLTSVVG